MKTLSAQQLAAYLCCTKRTVHRRALREGWPYLEVDGLGGKRRLYAFTTLPAAVQAKVLAKIIHHLEHGNIAPTAAFMLENTTPSKLARDCAKQSVLQEAYSYAQQLGEGKIKGFDQFCQRYNARELPIDPATYNLVRTISRITLLRLEKQSQSQELIVPSQPLRILPHELELLTLEILSFNPAITAKQLREHFKLFYSQSKTPTEAQISQWMPPLQTRSNIRSRKTP